MASPQSRVAIWWQPFAVIGGLIASGVVIVFDGSPRGK
jgi:hypothetical protein